MISKWFIQKDDDGTIWVVCNRQNRIWTRDLSLVEEYLAKWVKPEDKIRMVGFNEKITQFTGKRFLKEYNGNKTIVRNGDG